MQNDATVAPTHASRGLKIAGLAAAIVAVLVAAIGIFSRMHAMNEAQTGADMRSIPTVQLVDVKGTSASDGLVLPGTMAAWNAAKLYARVNGYIRDWSHDIGDQVAAGTALGTIETPDLDQQIGQAKANLVSAEAAASLAKITAQRWNALLPSNSVSKQEADEKDGDLATKNAAVLAAKADLARLGAMKDFATVRAPFAGIVTFRSADIGDLVGPGAGSGQQPLFSVADLRKIRIYVSVPQAYSAVMKPGLVATLTVPDYPGRTFSARVTGDANAVSAQTGTFQVELIADNDGGALKPGGYAQVNFNVAGRHGTSLIPSSTLVFRSQGTFVATLDRADHVRLVPIKVGRDFGGTIEVVSGLSGDQKIIDNPPDSISDGELVRINSNAHG
jgi:RND family efflux transporter MFP subunit